jgi:tetratricopeptide (TPR) repeat protein
MSLRPQLPILPMCSRAASFRLFFARLLSSILAAAISLTFAGGSSVYAESIINVVPGDDLIAVIADAPDGATVVLSAGLFNGPINVEDKALRIRGQADGSTVIFSNRSDAVLVATEGASVAVDGVVLEGNQPGQLGVYVRNATLRLTGSSVRDTQSDAIYVEGGVFDASHVKIAGAVGHGVAALAGSSVTIADSVITGIGQIGIILSDGVRMAIIGSEVAAAQGVVVQGGAPETSIKNTSIHSSVADHAGLSIQTGGPVILHANQISAESQALRIAASSDAPIRIENNLIYAVTESASGGIVIETNGDGNAEPIFIGNRILIGAPSDYAFGILLRGNIHASLVDNRVAVRNGLGVSLESGAEAQLSGNAILADGGTVSFYETNDGASVLEREILVPTNNVRGEPVIAADTNARATLLSDDVAEEMRNARDDAIDLAISGRADQGETVGSYFRSLDDRLNSLEQAFADLASISMVVVDATGRSIAAPFVLLDDRGSEVAKTDWANPSTQAVAGSYLLVPDFNALQQLELDLGAGEDRTVRFEQKNSLWLTFDAVESGKPSNEPYQIKRLVELRPLEERAAILATLRNVASIDVVADRRSEATESEMAAALAAARAWLQGGMDQRWKEMETGSAVAERFNGTNRLAYRILAVAGDATDVEWLGRFDQFGPSATYFDAWGLGQVTAALIEARLGRLETGRFAETAKSGKGAVAIGSALILHRFGIRDYDDMAIDAILSPANPLIPRKFAERFTWTFLDRGDEKMLTAVRALWDLYEAREAELAAMAEEGRQGQVNEFFSFSISGWAYLLAYGTPDDWRRVADKPIDAYKLPIAAAMLADIEQAEQVVADRRWLSAFYNYLDVVSAALTAGEVKPLRETLSGLAYQLGYERAAAAGQGNARQQGLNSQSKFDLASAPVASNYGMAKGYFGGRDFFGISYIPEVWVQYDWAEAEMIDALLTVKNQWHDAIITQLDYIPPERLEKFFADKNAAEHLPSADLLLAYHKVAKRAHRVISYSEHAVEGRSFVVSTRDQGLDFNGAISGRLDIDPYWIGSALNLRITLDLEQFLESGNFIPAYGAAVDRHVEYVSRPRTLIDGVHLRRGGAPIAIEELDDDSDGYVFRANLGDRALSDLWVDVDIAYFDQRYQLTFPLYFGPFAAKQNVMRGKVRAAETMAAATPEDVNALIILARAQRDFGDPTAAWASYNAALTLNPELFDLWFETGDMFAESGLPEQAVDVLEQGLELHPGDPDLTFALGSHAYEAGDYPRAAIAFGELVAASPDDSEARLWQANSLLLQRNWAGAAEAYALLPAGQWSPWIAMRSQIAKAEGSGGTLTDFSDFDATNAAMGEANKRHCDDDIYQAFRAQFSGAQDQAKSAFDRARLSCAYGSFERRLITEISRQ